MVARKKKVVKYQYLGEQDPAVYIHSNKTHRSASEAFRDADYATPIWKCKTDWDRTMEYIGWGFMWATTLGAFYLLTTAFNSVV